jgi:di/tricarboxylate transporter
MLIPLSQATVFGGTCTLIGTSTNLVVSGLQEQYFKGKPEFQFGFWDITPYGVPYAIWGMAYILLFSKWLLPGEDSETGRSDMISGLYVPEESYLVGKLARTSDLCKDGKAKLTAVAAKGHPAHPAPYDYIIQAGDTLYVTGG